MRTIWIITVLAMACSANAGPWLRPDGEGFMPVDSIGSIGRDQGDLGLYSGIFVEYGQSEELTLGFSGGLDQLQNGFATAYLRRAIPPSNRNWRAAYDLGIGADFGPDRLEPHLRIGMSVGRGGLFRKQTGWTHVDSWLTVKSDSRPAWKVEATLGNRGAQDWLYLMQLFANKQGEDPWQFELAPSIAIPLKRPRHLQIGLSASTQDSGRYGIKVSIWRAF